MNQVVEPDVKPTRKFEEALDFAFEAHRSHCRKGTDIPYFSHLLQVAGIVLEFGGNEVQAIAALLHDAVEDMHTTNARAIPRDYRALGDALFNRFNADKASTIRYYHSLIDAFRDTGANLALVDDLARTVGEFVALAYPAMTRTSSFKPAP